MLPIMYLYLYGALCVSKVMSFVDVDGTLPEVMYTILVYLFCDAGSVVHFTKEILSF